MIVGTRIARLTALPILVLRTPLARDPFARPGRREPSLDWAIFNNSAKRKNGGVNHEAIHDVGGSAVVGSHQQRGAGGA